MYTYLYGSDVLEHDHVLSFLSHAACHHGTEKRSAACEDGLVCSKLLPLHSKRHVTELLAVVQVLQQQQQQKIGKRNQ